MEIMMINDAIRAKMLGETSANEIREIAVNNGMHSLREVGLSKIVAGETSIPLARYGSSNAAQMKTAYRRGLGLRYGRAMQVIAGVHFNYSFSDDFWQRYQQLLENNDLQQDFISEQYMGLIRNLLPKHRKIY